MESKKPAVASKELDSSPPQDLIDNSETLKSNSSGPETASQPSPSSSLNPTSPDNLRTSDKSEKGNSQQEGNDSKLQPSPREIMNKTQGLNKNQTTMLIYANPDVRAEILISHLNDFFSEEQRDQAIAITMEFDEDVASLRHERSEILEHATNDQDVDQLLLENRRKTFALFSVIRKKVFMDVLTKEQKNHIAEQKSKEKKAK